MTRAGLVAVLEAMPEITVADTAADPATVVAQVDVLAPEVILLDPGDDAEGWLDDLWGLTGGTTLPPVVLLVGTPSLAPEALRAGVTGLLLRDATPEEIGNAVRAAASGLLVLDRRAAEVVTAAATEPARDESLAPSEPLTPREREVLQLIAQGLPNKAIAAELGISEHTVKFHVGAILDKLDAASRAEALARAARAGLIIL